MIIVDYCSKGHLKVMFKYSKSYIKLMRRYRKIDDTCQFVKEYKHYIISTKYIDDFIDTFEDRIIWRYPLWKIKNLKPPDYSNLYNVPNYDLVKMNYDPYNYQKFGIRFMVHSILNNNFSINSDDVGLGKSIQALNSFLYFRKEKGLKKCLIITKSTLKLQWKEEVIDFFFPLPTIVMGDGDKTLSKKKRESLYQEFNQMDEGFLIINHHLLLYDLEELKKQSIDFVIIDECQEIKARQGKMNGQAQKLCKGLKTVYLTATPIKSKPDDLFGIVQISNPDIFGSWKKFSSEYIEYEKARFGVELIGYNNLDKLRKLSQQFIIRRTEHEVEMELPKVIPKVYKVNMDKTQIELTNKIKQDVSIAFQKYNNYRKQKDKDPNKVKQLYGALFGKRSSLQAVANDPRLLNLSKSKMIKNSYGTMVPQKYKSSGKTNLALDLIKEVIDLNGKIIIFSLFERQVQLLKDDIKNNLKIEPLYVTGKTSEEHNQKSIKQFKNDPNCNVLLGTESIESGLNLQIANYILHFDLPKSQDGITQRRGRARRISSNHPIIKEWFILTKDSVEIDKFDKLKSQKYLSDGILGIDEAQRKELKKHSNK
jgi:SNF2 family DNA or RNA helicase